MAGDRVLIHRYIEDCKRPTKVWVDGLHAIHIRACCDEHERLVLEVIARQWPGTPRKIVE